MLKYKKWNGVNVFIKNYNNPLRLLIYNVGVGPVVHWKKVAA